MTRELEGSAPPVQPPPPRRATLLLVRLSLVAGVGGLALIGTILVAWLIENRRGQSAWERHRADLQTKGETLDLASVVPAPVPESENFAATPLLMSLFDPPRTPGGGSTGSNPEALDRATALGDPFPSRSKATPPFNGGWGMASPIDLDSWQTFLEQHPLFRSDTAASTNAHATSAPGAVLTALKHFEAELSELATAAAKPAAVFPLRYEENFSMRVPHLATLKGAVTVIRLRALAHLHADQTNEALRDVLFALRIGQALKDEPLIISQLVRLAMVQLCLQPVWEGLLRRSWNEPQLAQLQEALSNISLLDGYARCMRGERFFVNATLDQLRAGAISSHDLDTVGSGSGPLFRFIPSGWIQQNQVSISRFYQDRMLPIIDVERGRVFVDRARAVDAAPELKGRTPYNFLATLLVAAVAKTPLKFAHRQACLDLAATACALERFHRSQGSYPEMLSDLPAGLARGLHPDVITGEPLKYARTADGRYALYSVGWNEADDQGEPGRGRNATTMVIEEGDWVWKYSP